MAGQTATRVVFIHKFSDLSFCFILLCSALFVSDYFDCNVLFGIALFLVYDYFDCIVLFHIALFRFVSL